MSTDKRLRVIILGGGFGGLYAALKLEKTLARRVGLDARRAVFQRPRSVRDGVCPAHLPRRGGGEPTVKRRTRGGGERDGVELARSPHGSVSSRASWL